MKAEPLVPDVLMNMRILHHPIAKDDLVHVLAHVSHLLVMRVMLSSQPDQETLLMELRDSPC